MKAASRAAFMFYKIVKHCAFSVHCGKINATIS